MNATHESTCSRIRTEVVSRGESPACIVYIITVITGECVEILCRHVETYIGYIFAEPFVGEVVPQFYIGNLPISSVLDFT